MGAQQSTRQIIVQKADVLAVIYGDISLDDLIAKHEPVESLRIFQKPQFSKLIQSQISVLEADLLIKTFLSNKPQLSLHAKSDFITQILKSGKYTFAEREDTLLTELSREGLLDHLPIFKAVIEKFMPSQFPACIEQIRELRMNREFTPDEARCLEQQKQIHFENGFQQWLQEQYRLAALIPSSTVSAKKSMHKLFDDSAAKKAMALNKNDMNKKIENNHENGWIPSRRDRK